MRTRPATQAELVTYVKRKVREAQLEKDSLRNRYLQRLIPRELFLARVSGLSIRIATMQSMLGYAQRGELLED